MHKMAWTQVRLIYIEQGGKQLHDKKEIIVLGQHIVDVLDIKYNIQQLER